MSGLSPDKLAQNMCALVPLENRHDFQRMMVHYRNALLKSQPSVPPSRRNTEHMDVCPDCGGDPALAKIARAMGHRPDIAYREIRRLQAILERLRAIHAEDIDEVERDIRVAALLESSDEC